MSDLLLKKVLVCLIAVPVLSFGSFYASRIARAAAEKGLHREETIVSGAAKQFRFALELKEKHERERRQAAKNDEFDRFVYGTSTEPADVTQRKIEEHLRKIAENGSN